jgi:hypothetical protein
MPPFLRVFVCIALRMTGIFSSPTSSFASIHPLFAGKEDPLLRSCWLINIVLRWLPMPASAVPLSLSPVLTAVVIWVQGLLGVWELCTKGWRRRSVSRSQPDCGEDWDGPHEVQLLFVQLYDEV